MSVPSVVLSDTAVALPEQTVDLASIVVSGLKAQAWMSPDGSINLVSLMAPADSSAEKTEPAADDASAPPPPAVTPVEATTATTGTGAGKPWQVRIASVDVANASIDFEDRMKEPAKQFAIAPLNVRVGNASLDLAQPLPISIDAVINGHAPFKAEGTVTPEPLAAQLDVSLAKARMTILQPYVLPLADLTIKAGELGLKGKVRLDPPDAPGPDLSFDGDVTIDGFKSVDNALGKDLVNFRQVALGKLQRCDGARRRQHRHDHGQRAIRARHHQPGTRHQHRRGAGPERHGGGARSAPSPGGGRGENELRPTSVAGTRKSSGPSRRPQRPARHRVAQPPRPPRRRCRPKACRSGSAKCGSTTGPWISPTSTCSRTSRRRSCG